MNDRDMICACGKQAICRCSFCLVPLCNQCLWNHACLSGGISENHDNYCRGGYCDM